jgi:hypothetical protein
MQSIRIPLAGSKIEWHFLPQNMWRGDFVSVLSFARTMSYEKVRHERRLDRFIAWAVNSKREIVGVNSNSEWAIVGVNSRWEIVGVNSNSKWAIVGVEEQVGKCRAHFLAFASHICLLA